VTTSAAELVIPSLPAQVRPVTGVTPSLGGNVHVIDLPFIVTCSFGNRAWRENGLPVCFWHKWQLHMTTRSGSGPTHVTVSCPHAHDAMRVATAEETFITGVESSAGLDSLVLQLASSTPISAVAMSISLYDLFIMR